VDEKYDWGMSLHRVVRCLNLPKVRHQALPKPCNVYASLHGVIFFKTGIFIGRL